MAAAAAIAGKFVDMDWTASSSTPIAYYRYRLLSPQGRVIQHRFKEGVLSLRSRVSDGLTETVVERRNSPLVTNDNAASVSSYLDEAVQWSEFENWADVAKWASRLFDKAIQNNEVVQSQLAALTKGAPSDEVRVERILDFVQSDIRYFGTEIGVNSHLPADAQTVLKQRYGDCKDKAALLVSLLRAAGMQAVPVLVSMAYRDDADAKIPGPTAFDHAIVQLRLGGQTYWLDGTRGRQAGAALKWRNAEGLGKVLLADAGQTDLTRTPNVADMVWLEGRDVFHFTRIASPPRLEVSLTYHGELAEWIRNALATQSIDDVQKSQFAAYPRMYPHLQPQGSMQVHDDIVHNAVTLRTLYLVPDFLRFPDQRALVGDFALTAMMDPLRVQSQAPRTRPLYLWFQGTYRHEVNFEFEEEAFSKPSSSHFGDRNDFFDLNVDGTSTAKSLQIRGELRQNVNTIEVEDWDRYKDVLAKVWPKMGNVITIPAVAPAQADSLRRRVAAMSAELGRDRADLVTTVQAQSKIGIMLLEAVLGADRLPPQPRAETLVKLGETYDLMRDFDAGRQRFEQALALDPKTAGVHIGLAINSLGRHDAYPVRTYLHVLRSWSGVLLSGRDLVATNDLVLVRRDGLLVGAVGCVLLSHLVVLSKHRGLNHFLMRRRQNLPWAQRISIVAILVRATCQPCLARLFGDKS